MNPTNDRAVVLAVVIGLVVIAVAGVVGLEVLIYEGVDAGALAPLAPIVAGAAGALGGLLASTRTAAPALEQAKAEGYQLAVAKVTQLDTPPAITFAAPVVEGSPSMGQPTP